MLTETDDYKTGPRVLEKTWLIFQFVELKLRCVMMKMHGWGSKGSAKKFLTLYKNYHDIGGSTTQIL
jgi:hypothetical protein